MKTEPTGEGIGGTPAIALPALTDMMKLSCAVADKALAVEDPALSMRLHDVANEIAEVVGVRAEQAGYTMDEVMNPLWATEPPRQA